MPIDNAWITEKLLILIPLWLSLGVHECAHAWAAFRLGDDTAAQLGRMTLNPLAHIDPVGTLLLPLLGIPFGWATPVPVQPRRFHRGINMHTGMMLTAIAGPLSNVVLAAICILLFGILARLQPELVRHGQGLELLLRMLIGINIVLAIFNILPVPPLDGSRVADALMPRFLRPTWEQFCSLGPVPLIAVIVLPSLTGVNLFGWPLEFTEHLVRLAAGSA